MGPWLVTPDEVPDPDDLGLGCSVDGETVQDARTSDLIFSVPRLVAELSAVLPLLPGDVIFTGTPAGVGMARQPPRALQPGQVLETLDRGHRHDPQPLRVMAGASTVYAGVAAPNQVESARGSSGSVRSPAQATCPSGRISTAGGRRDLAEDRELPHAVVRGVDQPDSIRPRRDVEAAGFTEVEEHGPGVVQQGEHARRTVGGAQVEVGHAPPEQRVSLAEVVVDVEPESIAAMCRRGSSMLSSSAMVSRSAW